MKVSGKQIAFKIQNKIFMQNNASTKGLARSLSNRKNMSSQLQTSPSKKLKNDLKTIKQKFKRNNKQQNLNKAEKKKKQTNAGQKKQNGSDKKQKNKKKNFINLKELKPLNLQREKQLFFENDCKYNPFFLYPNISDLNDDQYKDMKKFQIPDLTYLPLAIKILQKSKLMNVQSLLVDGPVLTQEQTSIYFDQYINKLEISELLSYQFIQNTIAPTSVVHNNTQCNSKIMIGLPIYYRKQTIIGVMNHQIGTHFLRKFNDRNQKWYKDRKKYNLGYFLKTQEGLAAINQVLSYFEEDKIPPLLYRPALMYYCCYLASKCSFSTMYEELAKYQPNSELRWRQCVRVKRGIADTAKPNGMFKDQIYFLGALQVLKNRKKLNFVNLHCGKINVEDCLRLTQKNQINKQKIKIPTFLNDMKHYLKCLDLIAEINQIQ